MLGFYSPPIVNPLSTITYNRNRIDTFPSYCASSLIGFALSLLVISWAMLSEGTIRRIYYQGEDAIIRLVKKLEVRTEDLEAMHTSAPERRIASLSKELSRTRDQLSRQSEEHLQERQQNHLLVQ